MMVDAMCATGEPRNRGEESLRVGLSDGVVNPENGVRLTLMKIVRPVCQARPARSR